MTPELRAIYEHDLKRLRSLREYIESELDDFANWNDDVPIARLVENLDAFSQIDLGALRAIERALESTIDSTECWLVRNPVDGNGAGEGGA